MALPGCVRVAQSTGAVEAVSADVEDGLHVGGRIDVLGEAREIERRAGQHGHRGGRAQVGVGSRRKRAAAHLDGAVRGGPRGRLRERRLAVALLDEVRHGGGDGYVERIVRRDVQHHRLAAVLVARRDGSPHAPRSPCHQDSCRRQSCNLLHSALPFSAHTASRRRTESLF